MSPRVRIASSTVARIADQAATRVGPSRGSSGAASSVKPTSQPRPRIAIARPNALMRESAPLTSAAPATTIPAAARIRGSRVLTVTAKLLVALERGDGSLQRQLENQLRALIRSGRLVEGERLPASRALAGALGVSRGVVSDAYMQLAAEGWLLVTSRSAPRVGAAHGARAANVPATATSPAPPRCDLR